MNNWQQNIQSNILKANSHLYCGFWFLKWKKEFGQNVYQNWLTKVWQSGQENPKLAINLGITQKVFEDFMLPWKAPNRDRDYWNPGNFNLNYEKYANKRCQGIPDDPQAEDKLFCKATVYNHHILVIIYGDSPLAIEDFRLDLKAQNWFSSLTSDSFYQKIQRGEMQKNKRIFYRPFGFQDGISTPRDEETLAKIAFGKPASQIQPTDHLGTFLFLQKYELHNDAFDSRANQIVNAIKKAGNNESYVNHEYGKAMLMGRFENGTPLVTQNHPTPDERNYSNDFSFGEDADFARCPIHAHIRVANPNRTGSREHLNLIRRSVVFTETQRNGVEDQSMIFMSYQNKLSGNLSTIFKRIFEGPSNQTIGLGAEKDAILYGTDNPFRYDFQYPQYYNQVRPKIRLGPDYTLPTSYVNGAMYYIPSIPYINQVFTT